MRPKRRATVIGRTTDGRRTAGFHMSTDALRPVPSGRSPRQPSRGGTAMSEHDGFLGAMGAILDRTERAQRASEVDYNFVRPRLSWRQAWAMRCSFSMRAKRTYPSPWGPKPMPGDTATSQSVTTSLANSMEPRSR